MILWRRAMATIRAMIAELQPLPALVAATGFVLSVIRLVAHADWWAKEWPFFATAFATYLVLFAVMGERVVRNLPSEGEEWLALFSSLWSQRFWFTLGTVLLVLAIGGDAPIAGTARTLATLMAGGYINVVAGCAAGGVLGARIHRGLSRRWRGPAGAAV